MKNLLKVLEDYKSRGLIFNQVHPTLPLTIWNYTPETQYGGHWDEITLMCRGLVTDDKGDIVAKGFSKFFNMEEEKHVATDDFEIFEKLDGSLILVFMYEGQMIVASRGSFTSPYAIEARRILEEKYPNYVQALYNAMDYGKFTYCFELIGFEQIVVSYPEPDLVLTGVFSYREKYKDWMEEKIVPVIGEGMPSVVKKFDGLDWKNIKGLNWKNAEGFVVKFINGDRCKIKFEDYIKLHRQMTNLSTRGIWEALAAGEPVSSILNDVPDEFYDKIKVYEATLVTKYKSVEALHQLAYMGLSGYGYTRKEFANKVLSLDYLQVSINPIILFSMLDGKDYSKHIWKMIEPEFEKL